MQEWEEAGARVCIVGIGKREVCRNGEEMESQGIHYTGMGNRRGGGSVCRYGEENGRPECPGISNRQCMERISQGVQEREMGSLGRRVDQGVQK